MEEQVGTGLFLQVTWLQKDSEEVTVKLKPDRLSPAGTWGRSILGRENSRDKGTEVMKSLAERIKSSGAGGR